MRGTTSRWLTARLVGWVRQGIRAPWAAHEDLKPIDTSHGCEKALFFVYFVYFVVPSLRRAQAPRMAPMHLPEEARHPATLHAGGPQLSVCGTTKYTKYTKTRGKGCRIGRFVSGRSKVNALSRNDAVGSVVLA